jgi:hypothetical protein
LLRELGEVEYIVLPVTAIEHKVTHPSVEASGFTTGPSLEASPDPDHLHLSASAVRLVSLFTLHASSLLLPPFS